MELLNKTALEIGEMVQKRQISVPEITKQILSHAIKTNEQTNAYITILEEKAMNDAKRIQEKMDAGALTSPLAGVPMAAKDNVCTKDIQTTCASRMLAEFVPIYDAHVMEKLNASGAILIGKTNLDEFAMGGSTETSFFGPTKNPWDLTRTPGGSSGGSAAAVATDACFYALGTDTGGSIRQPSAFCGVTGIKPTYGSVSRFGVVAYASSLDQVGVIGKDIKDCAAVLLEIAGYDPKDATSVKDKSLDWDDAFANDVKNFKIGIPKNYINDKMETTVKEKILEAAKIFEKLGASIEEFEMPMTDFAVPSYYIIASAEASTNLSRFDGIKYGYRSNRAKTLTDTYYDTRSEGFGIEAKRRIMVGSFVLSAGFYDAYYKKAQQARYLIQKAFHDAFNQYDVILSPTAPTTAYPLGSQISDPVKMYLGDIYTASVNLAGLPAVSIPCGFDENGLPIGMQLIGKAFSESLLIKAAYTFQCHTDFHKQRPNLSAKEGNK